MKKRIVTAALLERYSAAARENGVRIEMTLPDGRELTFTPMPTATPARDDEIMNAIQGYGGRRK